MFQPRRLLRCLLTLAALGALAAPAVVAQPFGAWAVVNGTNGYLQIPHNAALGPTGALTIEAWVDLTVDTGDCDSIIGKNFAQTYWVGVCNVGAPAQPTLRSYLKGTGSIQTGGLVPNGEWTHIAVVYGGGFRRHYINGELALEVADAGALPTNTADVRIGSDVAWPYTPHGALDDVRLWNVARSQAQIRDALNEVQGAQPGLVANWRLDGIGDPVGGHNGTAVGSFFFLTFPVAIGCAGSSTILCLHDRFSVRGSWRVDTPPSQGDMGVVPFQTDDSGLLYFFNPSTWEIEIKVLDACGYNNRYWVYSAATTDLFYRVEVFDQLHGVAKIYFNYPGAPAPAVTDSDAFATCP